MKPPEQIDDTGRPPILLTTMDRELLTALLRESTSTIEPETAQFLREEIERADLAPEEASNMMAGPGSEVKFIDHDEQRVRVCRLVLPEQVEGSHCISVLSPTGSALVGLGPGQSIVWHYSGKPRAVTVLEVRRP